MTAAYIKTVTMGSFSGKIMSTQEKYSFNSGFSLKHNCPADTMIECN